MNDKNKVLLKRVVQGDNQVYFKRYFDGQLWYVAFPYDDHDLKEEFEFPVPVSEIGTATFLAKDKAMLFMRYIRKHLEMLESAASEQNADKSS